MTDTTSLRELPAKWLQESEGFSDGDAMARCACARELQAALSARDEAGAVESEDDRLLGDLRATLAGAVAAIDDRIATPPASGEAGAVECRERVVGYWNCKCPACHQRVAENTLATPPAASGDDFNGDNAKLIGCIEALLSLDAANALVPHGIGGHARTLLSAAARRLAAVAPAGMVLVPRDEIERAVKVMRYAAHPHQSPNADALAQFLVTPPATAGKE